MVSRIRLPLLVLLVATLGACTGGGATPSSGPVAITTSPDTAAPTTTAVVDGSTTNAPPVDPEVEAELKATIAGLVDVTEELRGLEFVEEPSVVILTPDEVGERLRVLLEEDLDPAELAIDQRFYEMMAMLDGRTNYRALILDLYDEQVSGFYNGETGEMVVRGDVADLSPYARSVVVHELVHALTDQHFHHHDTMVALLDAERYDEAYAFQAVVEGDATFHQLLYGQTLSPDELQEWAAEQLDADVTLFSESPSFVRDALVFAYQEGFALSSQIMTSSGLDGLNRAYTDPPRHTESVLHPDRYFGREAPRAVEPLSLTLPGFEQHEAGSFGELGLRLLLLDAVSLGEVSQAADGWGGDAYVILADGDDVAFVLNYLGDSERDAIELTEALIATVEGRMGVVESVPEAGGVLYSTEDVYVFIDRVEDRVYLVVTTDAEAGASLRAQLIG